MHGSNDWDATTWAGWKAETRGGVDSARGVPAATALLALSADMRCSCDVPGRPDMGDAGTCYVSLLTRWFAPRPSLLGVPKNGRASPAATVRVLASPIAYY